MYAIKSNEQILYDLVVQQCPARLNRTPDDALYILAIRAIRDAESMLELARVWALIRTMPKFYDRETFASLERGAVERMTELLGMPVVREIVEFPNLQKQISC